MKQWLSGLALAGVLFVVGCGKEASKGGTGSPTGVSAGKDVGAPPPPPPPPPPPRR